MGKIIAIANQKGGVGKTTTAVNLSAYLGAKGKKVLVCDMDPQANATGGLGVDKDELEYSIYDALINDMPLSVLIQKTASKNVDVVPSGPDLSGAEVELVDETEREFKLKKQLMPLKEKYDFILIDCPPSLGLLTINALIAADSLIIPIQCEYYALEGVTKLLESMNMVKKRMNPDLEIFGVVMTMFDSRTTLSKQVVDEVQSFFGKKMFKTIIPRNVKIAEAPSHGMPVSMYARISKGASAYAKLAKEVINRG